MWKVVRSRLVGGLLFCSLHACAQELINIDFGAHLNPVFSIKHGPAAVGIGTEDYWNLYSRDGTNEFDWLAHNSLADLKTATGDATGANLSVSNAAGAWYTASSDAMFQSYLYPGGRSGDIRAEFQDLPPGVYDIYVYAHGFPDSENAAVELDAGSIFYGTKATSSSPGWEKPEWAEGKQYVLYRNVTIPANTPLVVLSKPGVSGLAVINGMQILRRSDLGDSPLPIWAFATGSSIQSSPAIAPNGVIYFGSHDANLYALNPDGTKRWQFPTAGLTFSSPAIAADGTIYVGSYDKKLYAINPDGSKKWEFATRGIVWCSPAIAEDGTVYIGSGKPDHNLYALHPDGTVIWRFQTGGTVNSSPAIGVDGTIYFGSLDHKLYALNPDGSIKWARATANAISSSPAIGAEGTIYVGNYDGNLYAFEPADGYVRWATPVSASLIDSSPAIGLDGTIYIGSHEGKLTALNADGSRKWDFAAGAAIESIPLVTDDGTVLFGANNGKLYAVRSDGSKQWEYATGGGAMYGSPAIAAAGTLYFGSSDQKLYALDTKFSLANSDWPMFRRDVQHTGRVKLRLNRDCVMPNGLLAWWRAEGDADDSMGDHNGTLSGNVTFADGEVGQTFVFDGSGEVIVPDSPALNPQALTIEGWVFPTLLDGETDSIVNKEVDGFSQIQFEMGIRGPGRPGWGSIPVGNLAVYLGGVTGLPDDYFFWVDGGTVVPLRQWSHVAMTFDGATLTTYINGSAARVLAGLSGSPSATPGPLRIGSRSKRIIDEWPMDRFNGSIDELSLYGRALNAAEIQTIFLAGMNGKCSQNGLPSVVIEPLNQVVAVGGRATFNAVAVGLGPLSYQWQNNGANILGATGSLLVLENVQPSNAGNYEVIVSNRTGGAAGTATLSLVPLASAAQRQLPVGYTPGVIFTVTLHVAPPPGIAAYAIEELPPIGWTVGQLSRGGAYDSETMKVKFGPFLDAEARALTYEVKPPPDENGVKQFAGTLSVDGVSTLVNGAVGIGRAQLLHPADLKPADNRLTIDEITAYAAAWKKGTDWPEAPARIPIDYLTRAGTLWQLGETYLFDPNIATPPLWWVNAAGAKPQSVGAAAVSTTAVASAVRVLPPSFVFNTPFTVRVSVQPGAAIAVHAVEEKLPAGWSAGKVSDGGAFDSVHGSVKFGPFFDNVPRGLTYEAVPTTTVDGAVSFTGVMSVDGASSAISGGRETRPANPVRFFRRVSERQFELKIVGAAEAQYEIHVSSNLLGWTTLTTVTESGGSLIFTDPDANGTERFYYPLLIPVPP